MKSLKAAIRELQDRREERFSRQRRLIACGEAGLLRLEPALYEGPDVTLRSGVRVPHAARIGELHLDSGKTAEYFRDPPMRARVRLFRDAAASLRGAARWLAENPVGREVVGIRSVTLLDREMTHFGFEVLPLPTWPWILVGIHMRWLSYLYRDERRKERRTDAKTFITSLTPCQAWMSREEFLAKYWAEAPPT